MKIALSMAFRLNDNFGRYAQRYTFSDQAFFYIPGSNTIVEPFLLEINDK
jgi:hypothetical protein